jgi:cytochrome c peroxidase
VADTAPYFHNGSVKELAEAVRIMASTQLGYRIAGMDDNESFEAAFVWSEQASTLATIQPRQLSEDDIQSIVAFLQALSGELTSGMDF